MLWPKHQAGSKRDIEWQIGTEKKTLTAIVCWWWENMQICIDLQAQKSLKCLRNVIHLRKKKLVQDKRKIINVFFFFYVE